MSIVEILLIVVKQLSINQVNGVSILFSYFLYSRTLKILTKLDQFEVMYRPLTLLRGVMFFPESEN